VTTINREFEAYLDAEAALSYEEMGVPIRRILDEVEEHIKNDIEEVGHIQEHHTAITRTINGQQVAIEYEINGGDIYIN